MVAQRENNAERSGSYLDRGAGMKHNFTMAEIKKRRISEFNYNDTIETGKWLIKNDIYIYLNSHGTREIFWYPIVENLETGRIFDPLNYEKLPKYIINFLNL